VETKKIYVHSNETAVLRCPHCGNARTRYVGECKGPRRNVKIRCRCQLAFHVCFEFRRARRRETSIQGHFTKLPDVDKWEKMSIENVSLAGVGLLTRTVHDLSIGDQLRVRFNLNGGGKPSIVEKEAVVKWVSGGNIGCKFRNAVEYDDSSFHFYLMP
jgi:hypothetical protein